MNIIHLIQHTDSYNNLAKVASPTTPSLSPMTAFSDLSSTTLVNRSPAFPFSDSHSPVFPPHGAQKASNILAAPNPLASGSSRSGRIAHVHLRRDKVHEPNQSLVNAQSSNKERQFSVSASAAEKWEALLAAAAIHDEVLMDNQNRKTHLQLDATHVPSSDTNVASPENDMKIPSQSESKLSVARRNKRRGVIMI